MADVRDTALEKRELAYCLGWWVNGTAEKGKALSEKLLLTALSKLQSGDRVARLESSNDANIGGCYHMYRSIKVPLEHKNAASRTDKIKCQ